MIRLRRLIERGRAHPILGPILLIALVLLLAMTMLHAAQDGHGATEMGALCLAVITVMGLVLLIRVRALSPVQCVSVRGDRGPPAPVRPIASERVLVPPLLACPLRR